MNEEIEKIKADYLVYRQRDVGVLLERIARLTAERDAAWAAAGTSAETAARLEAERDNARRWSATWKRIAKQYRAAYEARVWMSKMRANITDGLRLVIAGLEIRAGKLEQRAAVWKESAKMHRAFDVQRKTAMKELDAERTAFLEAWRKDSAALLYARSRINQLGGGNGGAVAVNAPDVQHSADFAQGVD